MQFCKWLHQHIAGELFLHNIPWTDKACVTGEGVFSVHNTSLRKGHSEVLPQLRSASQPGGPGSSPGQVMWHLWWTNWHWGKFSPSTSVSPANSHATDFSTFIIIYHLGLVQWAKQWPMYQVDSVHPTPRRDIHAIRERGCHVRFSLSVWAGIVGALPWAPDRLAAQQYHDFLGTVLPGLLEDVPLALRQRLWF
jgi:hypothetical protein